VKRLVVLASGRGSNAAAITRATRDGVLAGVATVEAIVTNSAAAGVLERQDELGVPVVAIASKGRAREAWEAELLARVAPPDYWVLAGFMRILSKDFVSRFPERIVNIHPADTRVHQGLHGYEWAFEAGLRETWITVHMVDQGLDTGRVLERGRVDLAGVTTLTDVQARGLAVEHELYPRVLCTLLKAGT
jgi:phosphoribosylglycinamide formyltransferase-1